MPRIVVLDTGVLGQLVRPAINRDIAVWMRGLIQAGCFFCLPEIADYELRRELLHLGFGQSLTELDRLGAVLHYLPLTSAAMRLAAAFWAEARKHGKPTAAPLALDGDVILAAQTRRAHISLGQSPDAGSVVATNNVGHLNRFVPAQVWREIH